MKQHVPQSRRHVLKPADLRELLHEVLPIGAGEMPERVIGWTCRKVWTRIEAHYPNGAVLNVYFTKDGKVSSAKGRMGTMFMGVTAS